MRSFFLAHMSQSAHQDLVAFILVMGLGSVVFLSFGFLAAALYVNRQGQKQEKK